MTNYLAQQAEKEITTLHDEIKRCIESSLDKAIEIGERLSKAKGEMSHGEFGKWVEEKLPFSARSATRFINAFIRRKTLKATGLAYLDSAIKAAKPPAEPKPLEPPKFIENENNEPPAPQEDLPKSQPIMDTDPGGTVIPESLKEIFDGKTDMFLAINELQHVKNHVLEQISTNPVYKLVKSNPFKIDIDNCIRALKFAMPMYVCRYCSGSGEGTKIDEDCPCCKKAGWINKAMYDNTAPELK